MWVFCFCVLILSVSGMRFWCCAWTTLFNCACECLSLLLGYSGDTNIKGFVRVSCILSCGGEFGLKVWWFDGSS